MIHSLEVLNASGHLTLTWDPKNEEDVAEARKQVERLRNEGYTFFVVAGAPGSDEVEQGNGMIIVRRIADPTDPKEDELTEALPPEAGSGPTPIATKCQGTTQTDKPCRRKPNGGTPFCAWHQPGKKLKGGGTPRSSKRPGNSVSEGDVPPQTGRRHVAVRSLAGG